MATLRNTGKRYVLAATPVTVEVFTIETLVN
jgi:hypothetical protein